MGTGAEHQRRERCAIEPEAIRLVVSRRVALGGREHDQQRLAGAHRHATDLRIGHQRAAGVVNRRIVAQHLGAECLPGQAAVECRGAQGRVERQPQHAGTDQPRGGVMRLHQQCDRRGGGVDIGNAERSKRAEQAIHRGDALRTRAVVGER